MVTVSKLVRSKQRDPPDRGNVGLGSGPGPVRMPHPADLPSWEMLNGADLPRCRLFPREAAEHGSGRIQPLDEPVR
jgi:hypothetical protein